MRKVISSLFMTLDGVVESPDIWSFDHFDEGMMAELQSHLNVQDTVLMGRVTYEEWANYWPTSNDEPFASYINNTPKVVISTTLDRVDWQNSRLMNGSLAEEVNRLKQQPGQNIGTAGSPTLVRALFENDLLDELVLTIYPVVAGRGQRLFSDDADLKRLKMVDSKPTPTGVLIARYQPLERA